jgi:hypothetical protein
VKIDHAVLYREIRRLLENRKPILVVTTPGVPPPHLWQLPEDIASLSNIQTEPIMPNTWDTAIERIIQKLRPILHV